MGLILGAAQPAHPDEPAKPATPPPPAMKGALAPVAPVLPAPLVAAMQDGKYADAVAGLDRLIAASTTPADRAYLRFLRAVAERLDGKADSARATLNQALGDDPGGAWTGKIRYELAAVELAAGRPAAAEALVRAEAENLLAFSRKDRLAEVYHTFARRLLQPDNPVDKPNPVAAYALLVKARELAKGQATRASLLFAMGECALKAGPGATIPVPVEPNAAPKAPAGPPINAIQDLQTYLSEYPKGADRDAARFHLGEAQLAAGQKDAARITWTDLARDLAKATDAPSVDRRARSLFQITRTFDVPTPPEPRLGLAIAALRRFLADAPAHPLAVQAAFDIGETYRNLGRGDDAIAAYNAFLRGEGYRAETPEARKDLARLTMTATFQLAATLRAQGKFIEAITAWKGYLSKFPNGPQSADSQRAIIDTQLDIATDALGRQKYADARAAWATFVAENPLDPRVPETLFQVGQSYEQEEKRNEAVVAYESLIAKFPDSEPAAHAQFAVASIFETDRGDLAAAIERFRQVNVDPWKSQAAGRIAVMESKALEVTTPRTFRSGETAQLKVLTRNLETLTFSAYKINPEAYFRKKHALDGVESLDIGLVAPDAEWTVPVAGYARFKPIEVMYDLKVDVPGVYVVKVSDEKHLQAATLVVGSDIDAVVKVSRDQILAFAQDMKSGQGRKGARVLVGDATGVILEKTTGDDGVLLADWPKPIAGSNQSLQYLILDGPNVAGSFVHTPDKVVQGLSPRAYLYTDRPAYRPGQEVAIRGVVREVKDGQYANPAGAEYRLEVFDVRGRVLMARPTTLSPFGTFHQTFTLDSAAPVGTYRIRLSQPNRGDFSSPFEVQSYQLENLALDLELAKPIVFRGEMVRGTFVAKYQYGAPAAGKAIAVALPDGRTVRGTTDADGKFPVEFGTEGFGEEQSLQIVGRLPNDNVAATGRVQVAVRGFTVEVRTSREVYLASETFTATAETRDVLGQPTGQELALILLQRVNQDGRVVEREVARKTVSTDKATGQGTATFRVEDPRGGDYVVRASGTDSFGNVVFGDRSLTISGSDDADHLRLLADRTSFKVGETARVNLHRRSAGNGTALLAWEADRIIQYRLLSIKEGDNDLNWTVDGAQFPNFTLTASVMGPGQFDEAALDVRVERDLRLTITPTRREVGPEDEVEVEVTAVDQMGRPVAAEVGLALVDRALLRLYQDKLPPIDTFFYNQTRTGAISTTSTSTFNYHPTTLPVSEAVVEDAEQAKALASNLAGSSAVRNQAQGMFGMEGGMGGMGGAIGGAPLGGDVLAPSPAPGEPPPPPPIAAAEAARLPQMRLDTMAGVEGPAVSRFAEIADRDDKPAELDKGVRDLRRKSAQFDRARPREAFVETAYWNPGVVTGADGKARVKFKAPTALSEYVFSARGVSGSDTLVGQAGGSITVRDDFFVEIKRPARLTQGDRPRFLARVHHKGVQGEASVSLTAYAGGRDHVDPKRLTLKGDGVDEVLFDPYEVPDDTVVRLTVKATVGERTDEVTVEVPARPWGVQAAASASGTSSDDRTALASLPAGRTYENLQMTVVVSPTLRQLLIDLALGNGFAILPLSDNRIWPCPVPPETIADRASDLEAAAVVLRHLNEIHAPESSDAARLADRVRGLVSELITTQNDDGGWPWIAPIGGGNGRARASGSDRMATAKVAVALRAAWSVAMMTDPNVVDRATAYLAREVARTGADTETRATVLHALSVWEKATFEQANALARVKNSLNNVSLAYLALTFGNLDRGPLAGEILDVLATRANTEAVGPGEKPRKFWSGKDQGPWHRSDVETTSLALQAFSRERAGATETAAAAEWLLAHRIGDGWGTEKARGAAVAGLTLFYGKARTAEDRYRLVISVNDTEVHRAEVAGTPEGMTVAVPRKLLKLGDPNRVRFDIEGRGTFGYSVLLTGFARDFGPEQSTKGKPFVVTGRDYLPADPEFDGKTLPTGFGVLAFNPNPFTNKVTQVGQGGRARVRIGLERAADTRVLIGQPRAGDNFVPQTQGFAVVQETLPAGTTLIDGSIQSTASSYTVGDGTLTFFFPPDRDPGTISYEVFGYLPGQYRTLPVEVRSVYEPSILHLGQPGALRVRTVDEPATDPYRATPDELFARGKALFDAGRLPEAGSVLEELSDGYGLRDEILRQVARMLLTVHIKEYQPRKIVQDFEILKEKAPDQVIPFDEVLVVGRAYRDIGEHERAYLVFRAIIEASYLEDAQVGAVLRSQGKELDALKYLLDLWRESPDTASIETDLFGLAQLFAGAAGRAITDPSLRTELANLGATRSELLLQSIRLIQTLLVRSPRNPLADEASLALVGNFLALEDFETVVRLSERFARLFPRSSFLDSFQYSEALGRFNLGQYDRAVDVAGAIAWATYKDSNGVEQPSPNKWEAIYILGQIYDARQQPAKAVEFYQQVADRFSDAADAVKALTRKVLTLPEISTVRPTPDAAAGDRKTVKLDYRNVAEVDLKVYPVDLMRLYLTRRNLDQIAGIDLAGITPLVETKVTLGDGADFASKVRDLDLPLTKEGAYLVMARGGDLYASGIVLVTPLELEVLEEPEAGRVRVTVRDSKTRAFAPKVQVKVIGTDNPTFLSGQTDLRGVFVADGVRGQVTAVARRDAGQFAFHRGTARVGAPPMPVLGKPVAEPRGESKDDNLGNNLMLQNNANQIRQIERIQERYGRGRTGIKAEEAR